MAAPTFVTSGLSTVQDDNNPKIVNVSAEAGDVITIWSCVEDASSTVGTPTNDGTALSWALDEQFTSSGYTEVSVWSATVDSTRTIAVTSTLSAGTGVFGTGYALWRSCSGTGASPSTSNASGAPSLSITTTQDNSAVLCVSGDWSAQVGTTRTWRTVNSITPSAGNGELQYFRNGSFYTYYVAVYSDTGSVGAKTVGLSAPGSQKYAIVAVEIKGAGGGGGGAALSGSALTTGHGTTPNDHSIGL